MAQSNMIELDPGIPDNFLVLERKETFGDYARTYGNALAEHLENRGIIVVPFMPIRFDLAQFQSMTVPNQWKKIGTANGIEQPIFVREGQNVRQNLDHPLMQLGLGSKWAAYLQSQIAGFNAEFRRGLGVLFPAYHSLWAANITWRLTHTVEEGMHFDSFHRGAPLDAAGKKLHRVKIFMNIDTEPRVWRTSLDLPGALAACRDRLPEELPDDVNVVNSVIDKLAALKALPYHKLAFPTMSAVICNSEVVAHEVVYGRRVIGGEFLCLQEDMLDPGKLAHRCLRPWLEESQYAIAPDAAAIVERYAHLKHSDVLLQEARMAQQQTA